MTMLEVLKKKCPEAVKDWDGYDYVIRGPVTLDDPPELHVILFNEGERGRHFHMQSVIRLG